ncbi:MMPL family transporter [Amnibacterium flavum]|uniref:RND transporter n=1 Tax=Amnibacterium flavum TaxID=2173173 RepID=A0A2V1HSY8_9MICO|nr:MMPL family transporter [Amnibacterium flavum]PVZ95688.1 RND transporter [Amnibacterium flavum]
MAELLYRLGRLSARRAWIVIGAWLVVLAIAVGGFLIGFKGLSSSFDIPGTASSEVIAELEDKLPDFGGASGTIAFETENGEAFTDEQRAEISDLAAGAVDLPDVANVVDPFDTEAQRAEQAQTIADGRTQITDGTAQLQQAQDQIDAGIAQLDAAQTQLDAAREQASLSPAPDQALAAIEAQQAGLDAQRQQLTDGQTQLDTSRAELETQSAKLETGARLLDLAAGIRTVSEDETAALVNIAFTEPRLELSEESKQAVIEHFESTPIDGVEVAISTDIAQGVPEILGPGEVVGVAFAAIVLLVMLGSVIAASLPIVTAIVGVAIGVVGSLAFSGVVQMASVTPVLGVMLGLAVGIDYSLFIVNRHRKQLLQGAEVRESIGLANGTAGNAVVFAGATVVVALLALNVTGVPFLGLMGTVGAACVAVAVLIAVTLTPAILGLVGRRLLSRRRRARVEAGHNHAAGKPVRPMSTIRAVLTVIVGAAALLAIATPALSMRLGLPDGSSEPQGSTTYNAYMITSDAFGEGATGPLLVTADLPAGLDDDQVTEAQLAVAEAISDEDSVSAVAPIAVSDDNRLAAFQVIPDEGPNSVSTDELVRALRAMPAIDGDITLGVAGQAAINIDISENLADVLPLYLTVVVGLSLLIMIVVFRSLLVPLIATGGFMLSLFATFGALTAVFQWGWGAEFIGIQNTGPVLSFLPVILVGILFGLAMDYQLFLASGMREAFVHGSPARLAVAEGFRAGRSVVTAAALIMISVFSGFIFADATIVRGFGFGLAVGVLIDAFVVRMLIVPALMHLVGEGAWWLPRWLDRIVPDVDVEGAALERKHHLVEADPAN